MTNLAIHTLAARPALYAQTREFYQYWPVFMRQDAISEEHWHLLNDTFPHLQFALVDEDSGQVFARGHSLPINWDGTVADLPLTGWDGAWLRAVECLQTGRPPNAVSAVEITVRPELRGQGLSRRMVAAMRDIVRAAGFNHLVAPVRPSFKALYPLIPMANYMRWTQPGGDGPFDAWLRVHWQVGGAIVKEAPESMRIAGTVAQWAEWTGLHFLESGDYVVPGALSPVRVDVEKDTGVYLEPNVWVHHPVGPAD